MGIEKLDEYAAKFGLGQKTGVELSEAAGVVASPEFTESLGGKWYEGNVLSVAIGQESTQVTPIQLANYISTLANGGTRYTTHLLKTVKSGDFSQVSYAAEPEVAGTVEMKPENLAAVTRGMHSMTTGEGSLARVFQDVPVQVAAKTGSAQVNGQSNSNAVFVCYAPYDDPQIAISIAVEQRLLPGVHRRGDPSVLFHGPGRTGAAPGGEHPGPLMRFLLLSAAPAVLKKFLMPSFFVCGQKGDVSNV